MLVQFRIPDGFKDDFEQGFCLSIQLYVECVIAKTVLGNTTWSSYRVESPIDVSMSDMFLPVPKQVTFEDPIVKDGSKWGFFKGYYIEVRGTFVKAYRYLPKTSVIDDWRYSPGDDVHAYFYEGSAIITLQKTEQLYLTGALLSTSLSYLFPIYSILTYTRAVF